MDMFPASIDELARVLELDRERLISLAEAAPRLYSCRTKQKESGGVRMIEAPFGSLKTVHAKLRTSVLDPLPIHPAFHGVTGTSQISAAALHRSKAVVVTMDLKDFFPSVTLAMIQKALSERNADPEVAEIICRLVTRQKRLPQGAPTSPVLARIVLSPAIGRINGLLAEISQECAISVYVDDIALSGPIGLQRAIGTVRKILREHGFELSERKTRVRKQGEVKEVLGVQVTYRLAPTAAFAAKLAAARRSLPPSDRSRKGLEAWEKTIRRANRRG